MTVRFHFPVVYKIEKLPWVPSLEGKLWLLKRLSPPGLPQMWWPWTRYDTWAEAMEAATGQAPYDPPLDVEERIQDRIERLYRIHRWAVISMRGRAAWRCR